MVLFEGQHAKSEPTLNPWEMQRLMGLGINLGNVLETPFENTFAPSPTEDHFQMFHDAGFANIRIPVNWGNHMMVEEPYTMDKDFLARVGKLVDQSMAHGMVTIITAHHEWWIDVNEETTHQSFEWRFKSLPRFEALWRQVANFFRHHRQLLIFGILNEPHQLSVESLNELHRVALVAIRETNPSRIVTLSGKDFANPRWLLKNQAALIFPRDPQLMMEIHVTEPHGFSGTSPSHTSWGSDEDQERLQDWVHKIEVYGRRNGLPIYVAEFGCSNEQGESRKHWIESNWKEIRAKGFCASLWDDGDRFSIYSRENGAWDQEILHALSRSLPGLKGVGFRRTGGGLGGDSVDPTQDMQRRIENCFKRLTLHVDEVNSFPSLPDHEYISHTFIPANERENSDSEDGGGYNQRRRSSFGQERRRSRIEQERSVPQAPQARRR
jgi:endoglucanase